LGYGVFFRKVQMVDIVCFGEPLFEFNQQPDGRYLAGHGGDVSNCGIAAARSGASVAMLAHIGDDWFGASFLSLWRKEQIDTSLVVRNPQAYTGVYFVSHGNEGHQFSYLRAGSAASRFSPTDFPRAAISGVKILHVSGISQAISLSAADSVFEAMDLARANSVLVSYDTNLRTKLWPLPRARATIHAAMTLTDLALPGYDDAVQLTGLTDPDEILDFYLGFGVRVVALTLGAEGTVVATPERRQRIAAFPVSQVDATGAGDTFDGAFLAEFLRSGDPFQAARYANAAAALSTLGYGAVAPIPHRSAVIGFLEAQSK
jgi:2-dehydro-3-deoxygluconokinase